MVESALERAAEHSPGPALLPTSLYGLYTDYAIHPAGHSAPGGGPGTVVPVRDPHDDNIERRKRKRPRLPREINESSEPGGQARPHNKLHTKLERLRRELREHKAGPPPSTPPPSPPPPASPRCAGAPRPAAAPRTRCTPPSCGWESSGGSQHSDRSTSEFGSVCFAGKTEYFPPLAHNVSAGGGWAAGGPASLAAGAPLAGEL